MYSEKDGKLFIIFSNVDIFSIDKILELSTKLKEMEYTPHITALQEVKPKHYRYEWTLLEYKLKAYMLEQNLYNGEGRGLLIYTKEGTKFNTVELMSDNCEYCCTEVSVSGGTVLITSIYRSFSSDCDNNNKLLQFMQEIIDREVQYKLILGDFNLLNI